MVEAGFGYCKWLDLNELTHNLLRPHQQLIGIKYFTSRVSNNPQKQKRQTTYIEALESTGIEVIYGQYQTDCIRFNKCGNRWNTFNEKMTDVNIATYLCYQNFPRKRVFVAFPPKRKNVSVSSIAKGHLIIGRKKLVDSQFPDEV